MPPPSSSAFDDSPVTVVRAVLTSAEVRAVHAAASVLEAIQTPLGYDSTLRPAEEMPFGLQPPHTSLFLHADGCLARECPDIFRKIVEVARRCADTVTREPSQHLGVRTIEFHTYQVSGALLDPQHCDMGSVVTMSLLLCEPSNFTGGAFTTFRAGKPVLHDDLSCGDAIFFASERVHNVQAVMKGKRISLVLELWQGPDNVVDRHS